MNSYEIWVNLAPGAKDLELVAAIDAYMNHFKAQGLVESWRIRRRKFGFGPEALGEFCISLEFDNLTQMDQCFSQAATRSGDLEKLHAAVYSRVQDYRSGLYRDFPDPERAS